MRKIRAILKTTGGTGVQECLDRAVFGRASGVHPPSSRWRTRKWTDRNSVVLPDAYLMKRGSTTKDLAYRIHTDIGESFLFALDARTKMRLGEKRA